MFNISIELKFEKIVYLFYSQIEQLNNQLDSTSSELKAAKDAYHELEIESEQQV